MHPHYHSLANVAQSVERRHGKAEVSGSIPDIGSNSNVTIAIFDKSLYTFAHLQNVSHSAAVAQFG